MKKDSGQHLYYQHTIDMRLSLLYSTLSVVRYPFS